MNLEKEVFDIALKDIMPNRFQPREVFDETALNELSASIKEHGVIQPIIVRKVGDKYEIIAGERRFRASQLAGKTTIPALVRDIDDKEAAKIALLENLQRKDLTAIEEARTYQTILKLDNITQEELAANLGKSQSTIANKLRLLNLDESVQTALLNEKISERHARSLLNVSDPLKQRELLDKIILNRMTVRALDEEISRLTGRTIETAEDDNDQVLNNPTINQNQPEGFYQPISNQNYANNIAPEINQSVEIKPTPLQEPANSATNEEIKTIPENETIPFNNIFASLRVPETENNQELTSPINPLDTKAQESVLTTPVIENPINKIPVTPVINIEQEISEKESPVVNPTIEINKAYNQSTNQIGSIPVQNTPTIEQLNTGIYDLRFAINNVRQAVQNTEKFGFSIETEEFDFENVYQIVIKIDKNK